MPQARHTREASIPLFIVEAGQVLGADLSERQHEAACLALDEGRAGAWLIHRRITSGLFSTRGHEMFCACCAGRSPVLAALDQLFLDRVRGNCPYFNLVVLTCEANSGGRVRELLQQDAMISARYRT